MNKLGSQKTIQSQVKSCLGWLQCTWTDEIQMDNHDMLRADVLSSAIGRGHWSQRSDSTDYAGYAIIMTTTMTKLYYTKRGCRFFMSCNEQNAKLSS